MNRIEAEELEVRSHMRERPDSTIDEVRSQVRSELSKPLDQEESIQSK
uniref:Uncharacterized protein n=2 Tax=viral metagenome TaxID=1070528 RepID=A0A6H2A5Z7_9ZZZZ